MRRRDFVKGMVAIPAAASTVIGQQVPPQPSVPPPAASRPAAGGRGSRDFKAPPVTTVVPDAVASQQLKFFHCAPACGSAQAE